MNKREEMKIKEIGKRETLKQRILDEMVVDDEDWRLTKEIYEEGKGHFLPRIGLSDIYIRIKDLKKDPKSIYKYPYDTPIPPNQ